MNIVWDPVAEAALDRAVGLLQSENGKSFGARLLCGVKQATRLLSRFPNLGMVEPMLEHLPQTYRSLVVGHFHKMIYSIKDDTIHIVAFWDTRRDPILQASMINKK